MIARNLKRMAVTAALSVIGPRMRRAGAYQALFADAVQMQRGRLPAEEFRERLDSFFALADRKVLLKTIEFEARKRQLSGPRAYKVNIHYLNGDTLPGTLRYRLSPWARRFGLLGRLGIRSDILILRQGDEIPPHAHERVVSGFYVAEGCVHLRHYHRDRTEGDRVLLRKAIDRECEPGGFGTNSDQFQNVHWLAGVAPVSYLLRFTVTGVPSPDGTPGKTQDRIYVDPTAEPDETGVVHGRIISEEAAHALRMELRRSHASVLS